MNARERLLKNGLVVIDKVIRPDHRESLLRALVGVFRKYHPQAAVADVAWDSPKLHQQLVQFRQQSPKLFGAMYDTLQNCLVLQQIFSEPKLLAVVSDLLEEEPAGLTTTGLMLRMDPPFDARNSLAWHQESSYYTQNLGTWNGLVIWSPLLDMTSDMGPVEFCSASHLSGSLQVEHKQKADAYTSEQFRVEDSVIERFEQVAPLLKAGSVVAFTIHTIHRSGKNVSPFIRFAAGVRYHKIFAVDFLPGRVQYKPNLDVGRLTSPGGAAT